MSSNSLDIWRMSIEQKLYIFCRKRKMWIVKDASRIFDNEKLREEMFNFQNN